MMRVRAEAVLSASLANEVSTKLAELVGEWRATCLSSRRDASAPVVANLARLLRRRQARWTVATMLLDVSQNLYRVEHEIRLALADQLAEEREHRRAAYPFVPTNSGLMPQSLRCLLHKIRSRREDPRLCRYLQRLRSDD